MRGCETTLAAEWMKARTVPETWALAAGALTVGVGWATIPSLIRGEQWAEDFAQDGMPAQIGPVFWLGVMRMTIVIAMVLGAVLLTGERESGTAVVTRTVDPHPVCVYTAKVAVAVGLGLATGVLAGVGLLLGVRWGVGPVVAPLTTDPVVLIGTGVRVGVATAVCAALGVAVAALTRSLVVSSVIGFVWVWFENYVASLLGGVGKLAVMTPWRNLSYFVDQDGYGLPFVWGSHWGIAPLAALTLVLLALGAVRHVGDTNTIKE